MSSSAVPRSLSAAISSARPPAPGARPPAASSASRWITSRAQRRRERSQPLEPDLASSPSTSSTSASSTVGLLAEDLGEREHVVLRRRVDRRSAPAPGRRGFGCGRTRRSALRLVLAPLSPRADAVGRRLLARERRAAAGRATPREDASRAAPAGSARTPAGTGSSRPGRSRVWPAATSAPRRQARAPRGSAPRAPTPGRSRSGPPSAGAPRAGHRRARTAARQWRSSSPAASRSP